MLRRSGRRNILRMTGKLDAKERTPKEEYAVMRSSLRKSGLR